MAKVDCPYCHGGYHYANCSFAGEDYVERTPCEFCEGTGKIEFEVVIPAARVVVAQDENAPF